MKYFAARTGLRVLVLFGEHGHVPVNSCAGGVRNNHHLPVRTTNRRPQQSTNVAQKWPHNGVIHTLFWKRKKFGLWMVPKYRLVKSR
jgi:hypothetical protein